MKKSVFITGIAGSGKTRICEELRNLGFQAFDIEHDRYGLFMFIRKDTGERFMDYDNSDPEKTQNALWMCDLDKLKTLIDAQTSDVAFYCGTASNIGDLIKIFKLTILLQTQPEELNRRLLSREGTDDYANTKFGRDQVLERKDAFEQSIIGLGGIAIDATTTPIAVASKILALVNE